MKITLFNKCSKDILVSINESDFISLCPLENKGFNVKDSDKISVCVRKKEESCLKKSMFKKKYIFTVKTHYVFDVKDSDLLYFTFLRETIRVSGNTYYDKIIFKEKNENVFNEKNSICNFKHLKDLYKKGYLFYTLFVSPFEHMTFLCLIVFVFMIIFLFKIGILFSLFFTLCSYLIILLLDVIVAKAHDLFSEKIFGLKNDKKEFMNLLDENNVNLFYQHGFLDAYNGEIYIDEI